MDILNKLRKFKASDSNRKCNSFWGFDDDCSQTSFSTTSLSIDTDEFKYMDDDSESSSSDEIYSLETSLIETNNQSESLSMEDKSTHNQNWCHQATPIIGRSINFYDNDNFTDDTLSQMANKGFAQSLSRQTFAHKHIYSSYNRKDASLDELLLLLKDKRHSETVTNSSVNLTSLPHKIATSDTLSEHSCDIEMDNDDLRSISSLGSDLSTASGLVISDETNRQEDNDVEEDSNLLYCRNKFGHKPIHVNKPKLLIFSDTEDIESLSPVSDIRPSDKFDDKDDDDNSTICGDNWKEYQDIELYKETLYHQPPKSVDRSAAQRLARRLFDLDGFKLNDVSKHLSKRNDFNQIVGEEFANFFEFTDLSLDSAMRKFLDKFVLGGDTPERERVIHHFSRRYLQCNPNAYKSEEACHTLVCAVMLLNTDLHGNTVSRKMSCEDFIFSMSDLNHGESFENEELTKLFQSILDKPIRWNLDNELIGLIQPKIEYADFTKKMNTTNFNFCLEVPSESTSKEYMSGYLLRKCIKESHFRRTSIGKRGWKLFFGRLQDLTLYLYNDEISLNGSIRRSSRRVTKEKEMNKNGNSYSDPVLSKPTQNSSDKTDTKINGSDFKRSKKGITFSYVGKQKANIPVSKSDTNERSINRKGSVSSNNDVDPIGLVRIYLNHAFASKATDYSKKRNVFRLQVSSGSEYLFQVNEPREVELWVDCLNFVAGLLSPPLFNNCSNKDVTDSSSKKSNPVLTTLNIKEQLESHQRCVLTLEQDLMHLNSKQPSKSDKTKLKWQFNRQRKFIEKELIRYKIYSRLLEFELIHLHNIAISRMNQHAFVDPYLIQVQYSHMSGASPVFYNQQTNQFVPLNCVSSNLPVFQYHPSYGGPTGVVNNCSIKELSEDPSPHIGPSPKDNPNTQPIIIRSSYPCNRNSRSQLNVSKRRRYRNSSLQQQTQPIVMHYNPSIIVANNKTQPNKMILPSVIPYLSNSQDSRDSVLYSIDCDQESLTPKNSGKKVIAPSLPNIQQSNGTSPSRSNTFYEIL